MSTIPIFHYCPSVTGGSAYAVDLSPYANHGRVTAWDLNCTTPKAGRRGLTLTTSQYATFLSNGAPPTNLYSRSATVSCWAYLIDTSFQGIITRDDAGSFRQWWIDQYSGNWRVGFFDSSGSYGFNQYACTINKWTHICGTFSGYNARLYVDGVFRGSNASYYGGGVQAAQQRIVIGRYYNYALPINNGCVDDCRIYNVALNSEDVAELYAQGPGHIDYLAQDFDDDIEVAVAAAAVNRRRRFILGA